jgi:hypothetical protein
MDTFEIRKQLQLRLSQMDNSRNRYREHWKDIKDYLLPEHGIGLSGANSDEQLDGSKKHDKILDNTASKALNVLAAGLQSGLTSPSRPWFRLALADKSLMAFKPIKIWLADVEDALRYVFSRSNLYRSLHHSYLELGAFGTGAQMVQENYHTGIHCRPFTIGEYWLGLDHLLKVNTFYRSYWANATQLIGEFGRDAVSDSVIRAYDTSADVLFECVQAIEPNDDRLDVPAAHGRAFRSVYFERATPDTGKLLRVSGYDDFPVQAPRWVVIGGKTYGASCGMENLGDIKMLQKINEKQLINLDKALEPPLRAPAQLKNEVINTVPGGITYSDDLGGRDTFGPLYNVPVLINEAELKIQNVQQRIQKGFFSDLFLMLANLDRRNMTATEVAERHEEKLLMLGPVLERLDGELLDPLIDRAFNILMRAKMLPLPPPDIQGANLHVEYVSVLAQAQRLIGVTGVQQFAGFVGSLAAIKPDSLDTVDFDHMILDYGERVGISPEIMVDPEVVKQIRVNRAKQAAQQAQAAASQQLAEGAKTLSEADMSGNNALNVLMGRTPGITPPPN